jgi:hypothetical protein
VAPKCYAVRDADGKLIGGTEIVRPRGPSVTNLSRSFLPRCTALTCLTKTNGSEYYVCVALGLTMCGVDHGYTIPVCV